MRRLTRKKALALGALLLLISLPLMACNPFSLAWYLIFGFPHQSGVNYTGGTYNPGLPEIADGPIAFEAKLLQWHLSSDYEHYKIVNGKQVHFDDDIYDAASPDSVWQPVIAYWKKAGCTGTATSTNVTTNGILTYANPAGVCENSAPGTLQCAEFVQGVFGAINDPLPAGGNGADYWGNFQSRSGWKEITNSQIVAGKESPQKGDIMGFGGGSQGFGHVAIVVDVQPPTPVKDGYIVTANANAPGLTFWHKDQPGNFVYYPWTQSGGVDVTQYMGKGGEYLQGFIRQTANLPTFNFNTFNNLPNMPKVSADRQQYVLMAEVAAAKFRIPVVTFVRQINQESGFNPKASSGVAFGIAQFQQGTADAIPICVTQPSSPADCAVGDPTTFADKGIHMDIYDPQTALNAAAYHMAQLYAHYLTYDCPSSAPCINNDVAYSRALGGYNAGEGGTNHAIDMASNTWLYYLNQGQKDQQTKGYVCIIMGAAVAQESWIAAPISC